MLGHLAAFSCHATPVINRTPIQHAQKYVVQCNSGGDRWTARSLVTRISGRCTEGLRLSCKSGTASCG